MERAIVKEKGKGEAKQIRKKKASYKKQKEASDMAKKHINNLH